MLTREDDIDVHPLRRQGWTISASPGIWVETARPSGAIWPGSARLIPNLELAPSELT